MLRRIALASLLFVGSGASAATHESLRLDEQSARLGYDEVAGCVETFVSVEGDVRTLQTSGAPVRRRLDSIAIRIRDNCTGTDILVANHFNEAADFDQHGVRAASLHDEFTTTDGHQIRIDVAWKAEKPTDTIAQRGILRDRVQSPDEIASQSDRRRASEAAITGTLVVDGVATDLSAGTGLLLVDTRSVSVVAR